jgi:hypothetical protein
VPVSQAAMKTSPYQIGPVGIRITHTAVPHFAHDATDRVTQTVQRSPNGVYNVTFGMAAGGDTIYLPYRPDEIHSIRLPANPGPAGARFFHTANLDGCCMFIDVKTNGDLVVYHANSTIGVAPTVQQSATQPTFQTPGCLTNLQNLYNGASAHYPGANTHHVAFAKARYLREVDRRLVRKTAQGRTGAQFGGTAEHASLTTFAGFFVAGKWEFWFQTYSQFIYDRPATHWKSRLGRQTVNPHVTQDPYEVVESARVFRAP